MVNKVMCVARSAHYHAASQPSLSVVLQLGTLYQQLFETYIFIIMQPSPN